MEEWGKPVHRRRRLFVGLTCAASAIVLLCPAGLSAGTYYVRTGGNDSDSGSFPSRVWQTLAKAAATAKAGDTVIVGAGEFVGQMAFAASGTADAPIVFLADTGGEFTTDVGSCVVTAAKGSVIVLDEQSHIQFRGMSFRGTGTLIVNSLRSTGIWFHECQFFQASSDVMRFHGSGSIQLSRCTFRDNGGQAIKAKAGASLTVRECLFTKNAGGVVSLESDDCSLRMTRSRLLSNGNVALQLGASSAIVNCLLAKNRTGIVIDADKVTVAFCTLVDQQGDACVLQSGEEVIIANSIVTSSRGRGIERHSGQLVLANNLVFDNRGSNYEGTAAGPTDLKAPPLFADEVDYQLGRKSPAINAATYMELNEDLFGSNRPLGGGYDIGCHEFISPKRPNVYYVRRTGDDTNDGSRPKSVWRRWATRRRLQWLVTEFTSGVACTLKPSLFTGPGRWNSQ